ncbi:MAG: hypothetical protein GX868_10735 [Actinobacteria bacterium]|nr:hypothetical protein [Actinomycetota bacterium]
MRHLALLIVLLAGLGVFVHFWSKASKERRDVLARIDRERSLRPGYSPTAELFRETGAPPVFDDAGAFTSAPAAPTGPLARPPAPVSAPTAPAAPPAGARVPVNPAGSQHDLPRLFESLAVPDDFVPVEPATETRAVFAVERSAAAVRTELATVLADLDLSAVWHEPTVATVTVGLASGLVTIYPNAGTARDLEGRPLFPTARPDETVVRFTAV